MKTGRCHVCGERRKIEQIHIYHPADSDVIIDTPFLCEDCEEANTEACHNCGKHIYLSDIGVTDWHIMIPYDDDFESDDDRYDVISTLEGIFFCDQCMQKMYPDKTWQEIVTQIKTLRGE